MTSQVSVNYNVNDSIGISNYKPWIAVGKLGLDEFTHLWKKIRVWCEVFKRHDADGSQTICANELRSAFQEAGLSVNQHILRCLVLRYGSVISGKNSTHVERSLTFDDFLHCCIKLKHSIETFKQQTAAASPTSASMYGGSGYGQPAKTATATATSFTIDEVSSTI